LPVNFKSIADGKVGNKAYALLRQAMFEDNVCGLAQVVITSREHLVMVRAVKELLVMSLLEYPTEVKSPTEFIDDAPTETGSREELKLTRMLVKALEKSQPHLEEYRDLYYERLQELIEAKVAGREIVTPPESAPVRSVNFMEALKASMKHVQTPAGPSKKSAARRTNTGHAAMLKKAKQSANRKRRKSG
jgi:DNA end-binding protein Ku